MGALHRFIHVSSGRAVSLGSAAAGLGIGGLAGGLLFAAASVVEALTSGPIDITLLGISFIVGLRDLLFSSILWWIGLLVLAAPAWMLLHRLKLRCWSAAMALGAVMAPMPVVVISPRDLPSIALFGAAGALVGLVVWLVAYGKVDGGAVCA